MKKFDYIFAGAGCAGLSMVFQILNSPLKSKNILLIDPQFDQAPNKTWCYWAEEALPVHPPNSQQSWSKFTVGSQSNTRMYQLDKLKYWHINSKEFYDFVLPVIQSAENVEVIQDSVNEINDGENGAKVITSQGTFAADYVFDSRLSKSDIGSQESLKQIFAGWRVEFEQPAFDPSAFNLMEVDGENKDEFNFYYVLPYSDRSALIEYTKYDTSRPDISVLEDGIRSYIHEKYGEVNYRISFEEDGIIPMTTINQTSQSKHIIPIGTKAGWTKPSTGYTFHTVQKNCETLIDQLQKGENLRIEGRHKRFKFYDNILLNIAHKWPNRLKEVFDDLFKRNSPDQVFQFLGESTSLSQEIRILSRLRFGIFLKSLFSYERH